MKPRSSLLVIIILICAEYLHAQTEMLDSTFNSIGMVTTDVSTNTDLIYGIAIQTDGKIVAAGTAKVGGVNRFAVLRYNTDGSLDNTFGTGGMVTTPVGGIADGAAAVAIQSDGKIVAAGYAFNSTVDFAVIRYNTDGTLDYTFDGDGKATAAVGTGHDIGRAMLIQPDGKIVVAGRVAVGSVSNFGLARFNTDGSLDNTFDSDGVLTTAFGSNPSDAVEALGIAIQADGKLVVTGDFTPNSGNDALPLARYNTDGSLDNTFGTGGKALTHVAATFNIGKGIVIQPDGKLLVASESNPLSQDYDFVLLRYNTDGTPDNTFGSGGVAISDLYGNDDRVSSLALQPNGRIVVAGYTWIGTQSFPDFALARYMPDGTPDNSFGTGGKIWTEFGTGTNTISAIALQADGKIVAGGAINSGTATSDFALSRYVPDNVTGIIDFDNSANHFAIYPNPGNGVFHLSPDNTMLGKDYQLEVTNAAGEELTQEKNADAIDLSKQHSGVYFVKINDGQKISCIRILKY